MIMKYTQIFVIIYEWYNAKDVMRWMLMRVGICVDKSREVSVTHDDVRGIYDNHKI